MRRHRVHPLAACTIASAAAVLGSFAMPGLARGDDGLAEPLASVTAAAGEAPQAVVEEALAAVTEEVPTAQPPVMPDAAENAPSDEPTGSPPDATAPGPSAPEAVAEPVAEPVAAPDPAEHEASGLDTMPIAGDIAVDTPLPAPAGPVETAPVAPVAETAQPEAPTTEAPVAPSEPPPPAQVQANVNVSVRIGSPGDDGPVTQVNVVSGESRAGQARSATAQPPARDATSPERTTGGAGETWYWRWDCVDVGSLGAISPFGSATGSVPSSWTWIWNCGDKSSQYQNESIPTYPQINTNIAIRFASPGNDGSVTQVNVGAGVRVSVPGPTLPRMPALPSVPATQPPAPALPFSIGASTEMALTLPLPLGGGDITLPSPVSAPALTVPSDDLAAIPQIPPPATQTWPRPVAHFPFGAGIRARRPATAASLDERIVGDRSRPEGATASAGERAVGRAVVPVSQPKPEAASKQQRSAPRWRPAPLGRSGPARISTASVAAAAGGGGSSGSGLPFLLALPFVAALLDLARRVALEHATWPTGHRRRAPDRPG